MDRPDEAIDELRTATELAPADVDTWIELGLAYQAAGRGAEEVAAFRHALGLAPESPEARFQLQKALGRRPG